MNLIPDRSKYLGFDDRVTVLLGIPVVAFIIPVIFFPFVYQNDSLLGFCEDWIPGLFFSTILWIGNRRIVIEFRKRYFSKDNEKGRIPRMVVAVIVFTSLVNLIGFLVTPEDRRLDMQGSGFGGGLFITLFIVSIYEAIWASYRLRSVKIESEKLKRAGIQSQLNLLKSQVNPHFLFNSLNTLASIIPEEPDVAVKFVQNLSRVYRSILEIRDKEVITLQEELNYIESYIYLLKARFGDSLDIQIELSEASKEKFIVPLALQILFENAIKHNVVSRKRPLRIEISASETGGLVFRNNLQLKDQQMESTGTGLANINKRFRIVSHQTIEVKSTEDDFTVILPLLTIDNYESSDH